METTASGPAGGPASGAVAASDREIVLSRVFDAPRELVFEAYTDPRQLSQWWGPRGFTTTTHQIDVRPGGVWRFTMHGPDGTDYPNRIAYGEIVPPERISFVHDGDEGEEPDGFQVSVTFEALPDGRTLLTSRMLFRTREERDHTIGFGAVELGQQTLDRLAEHLAAR